MFKPLEFLIFFNTRVRWISDAGATAWRSKKWNARKNK